MRRLRYGVKEAGNELATNVDTLLGRFCCMNRAKSGVMTVVSRLIATPERSTSPEAKKNVRSRTSGPPLPRRTPCG